MHDAIGVEVQSNHLRNDRRIIDRQRADSSAGTVEETEIATDSG
jgi:hypothetical protein